MKKYHHVFFDLDHTLWDFERNSEETLYQVFDLLKMKKAGISSASLFIERYHIHNDEMWALYQQGLIDRDVLRYQRWAKTLIEFGVVNDDLVAQLGDVYLQMLPEKMHLFDDTIEVLDYLKPKYKLHIITNGFEEVQFKKINNSGINHYFDYIITSETAGYQKPDIQIFKHAFQKTNASAADSIFIGDSLEADIEGAKRAGMDHVFYNPKEKKHSAILMYEISELKELKKIL